MVDDAVAIDASLDRFRYSELPGRELTATQREQFLDVLQLAFGGWPAPDIGVPTPALQYVEWKLEGPPGLETLVRLVEDGGRIVGVESNLHQLAKLGAGRVVVSWETDAAHHPDYQGLGLTRWRLERQTELEQEPSAQQLPRPRLAFGTSSHPAVFRTRARQPDYFPPVANEIQTLLRVLDLRRILATPTVRRRDRRVPAPAVAVAYLAARALGALRAPPYRVRPAFRGVVHSASRVDERIARFYERAAEPFEFIGLHTAESFRWRYLDPRGGAFAVTFAEEGEELAGVLVRKTTGQRGYICELLTLPGRTDVARALVEDALAAFGREDVAGVLCWLPRRHPHQRILRRYGFVDSRRPIHLGYKLIGSDPPPTGAILARRDAAIHLPYGHSDAL